MRLRAATVVGLVLLMWSVAASADPIRTVVTFNADGSANAFPFGSGPGEPYEYLGTYQQLYRAAAFSVPVAIDQVAFRTVSATDRPTPPTWSSSFSLRLGTTASSNLFPTSWYEANRRGDLAERFAGTVTVAPTGSGEFDFLVPLTAPFLYDPAAGNLLLEVFINRNSPGVMSFAAGSSTDVGRVFNFGGTGSSVANGGYGLATRFAGLTDTDPAPVPEPATLTLIGSGLLGLVARARRRAARA